MISTGLDRLMTEPRRLAGRRYGLLAHAAAVTMDLQPAHLALARSTAGSPAVLFGPEHGYYGVEQDMIEVEEGRDPLTGLRVRSLYGDSEASLRPSPEAFAGLDLLVVDLQDVGARYYTYAATAVWAAAAALEAGCEVWVLDRPNPLGGAVEGNLPEPGFESFVGAFRLPVRHGLTLGEIFRLEARRRGWPREALQVWPLGGWRRGLLWPETRRPWIAPSPNMPDFETALVYPGACLLEATVLSEGRGTTRPFRWCGAPGVDPRALTEALAARRLPGVRFLPLFFRPHFQKHRGAVCGGVEMVVTDPRAFRSLRTGVELLAAFHAVAPRAFAWRGEPYEFVHDRAAIDLLTGGEACRRALESGDGLARWIASWEADEESFRAERREILLYPEEEGE